MYIYIRQSTPKNIYINNALLLFVLQQNNNYYLDYQNYILQKEGETVVIAISGYCSSHKRCDIRQILNNNNFYNNNFQIYIYFF